MLRSEDAIEAVDDGLSACLPPSLNESWRDVVKLRLRCQELFVFLNIKYRSDTIARGSRTDAQDQGCCLYPGAEHSYGLAQLRVPSSPRLQELRGPLSIKRLAAMCAPTTFTDWKKFFTPHSQTFQKLPAPFYNLTYDPSCFLFYPSIPVRIPS